MRCRSTHHTMPGRAVPLASIPCLSMADFQSAVVAEVAAGGRIAALFGDAQTTGLVRIYVVLDFDRSGEIGVACTDLSEPAYPALTLVCPSAHWFERELAEQYHLQPQGHPWLKPVRFQPAMPRAFAGKAPAEIGRTDFFQVKGPDSHEVAVGPVHAGVIEPGHFRFQCIGEEVLHLEISLGYQHRGVERFLTQAPAQRVVSLMETVAGDTTIGHTWSHACVVEALAGCQPPERASLWRGIMLELERLANHTGDLGAIAGDVGFLPTLSYCGRLRGDFLNMSALVCGSRFGRGLVRPGGVLFDGDAELRADLRQRLAATFRDVAGAVGLMFEAGTVVARCENIGVVSTRAAKALGLVGPVARASGVVFDARRDFPVDPYHRLAVTPMVEPEGDVLARAKVRWREIETSVEYLERLLAMLDMAPDAPMRVPCGPLAPDCLAVGLIEGWRGEVCHVGITGDNGGFRRYKIVDPSFHNWFGLSLALRGQQISDFPLCNKSFNLSYCGHDL